MELTAICGCFSCKEKEEGELVLLYQLVTTLPFITFIRVFSETRTKKKRGGIRLPFVAIICIWKEYGCAGIYKKVFKGDVYYKSWVWTKSEEKFSAFQVYGDFILFSYILDKKLA